MTNGGGNPCYAGLTSRCFQQQPKWARQAFAYRLLHAITPKALSKRLPKELSQALVAPGVTIPPGVELPPGATIPPGGEIPSGYTPDQALPGGSSPPPTPDIDTGAVGPTHTTPGPSGSVLGGSKTSGPGITYLFNDPFDTFPGTFWTESNAGDGDCSLDSGRLKMSGTFGVAQCYGTVTDPWPTDYDILFTMSYSSCDFAFRPDFYTGVHRVGFLFNCPTNAIFFRTTTGDTLIETYAFGGKTITFKVEVRSGVATVYRDTTQIGSGLSPEVNAANPGKINFALSLSSVCYMDDVQVVDRD